MPELAHGAAVAATGVSAYCAVAAGVRRMRWAGAASSILMLLAMGQSFAASDEAVSFFWGLLLIVTGVAVASVGRLRGGRGGSAPTAHAMGFVAMGALMALHPGGPHASVHEHLPVIPFLLTLVVTTLGVQGRVTAKLHRAREHRRVQVGERAAMAASLMLMAASIVG